MSSQKPNRTRSASSVTSTPDTRLKSTVSNISPLETSSTPQRASPTPQSTSPRPQSTSPRGRAGVPSNHAVHMKAEQQELGADLREQLGLEDLTGMQSISLFVDKRLLTLKKITHLCCNLLRSIQAFLTTETQPKLTSCSTQEDVAVLEDFSNVVRDPEAEYVTLEIDRNNQAGSLSLSMN
jgi:hypothetical protein